MSLTGFFKQINKANQMLSEKIGGVKGTEFDGEFQEMEKKTDVINRLLDDVRDRTNEYLQPNPVSRAKLSTANSLSKMRGQVKNTPYPQPEGVLGETMSKYGQELGHDSVFGMSLIDMGESMRQMAGIKYALEDNIKQNFLDPLATIKENELKEVIHLRKKTENRRLDYDCKKRKKSATSTAVTDEELNQAAEKFEDTRSQTDLAMQRLLGNEVEHITHLTGFAEGFLEYHRQCTEILRDMVKQLNEKKMMAIKKAESNMHDKPKNAPYNHSNFGSEKNSPLTSRAGGAGNGFTNDPFATSATSSGDQWPAESDNNSSNNQIGFNSKLTTNGNNQPPPINQRSSNNNLSRICKALYDFEAENAEELDFKEGDNIKVLSRLDENWLQGEFNGRQGRFPVTYVELSGAPL